MNLQSVRQQIDEKIWRGEFWGSNGALCLSRQIYDDTKSSESLMELALVYEKAWENAEMHISEALNFFEKALWRWQSWIMLSSAKDASEQAEAELGPTVMSADQMYTRALILFHIKKPSEALERISCALDTKPSSFDTQVLLLVLKGLVEQKLGQDSFGENSFSLARNIVSNVRPKAHIEYFKARGKWEKTRGNWQGAKHNFLMAKHFASNYGCLHDIRVLESILGELSDINVQVQVQAQA